VDNTSFAELLRQHRLALGLTQDELAERASLSGRAISDLERGVKAPRLSTARLLVRGLGLHKAEAAALLRTARPQRDPGLDADPGRDRHNLPLATSSLVGRAGELAQLEQRLRESRLVTITGVGGCGKTRLALQVAHDLMDAFPQGAWWVELAPLSAPTLVPQAVAAALGLREQPGRSLLETLCAFLAKQHLLLVLDNCEHVVATCADLAETLLRASATVRLLTTSREALRIPGEVTWRVPPLATPDPRANQGPTELLGYPAVQLFVERAQAIQPTFTLRAENARAVAAVSARLDGLPLAIELAAAWVRALGIEQLLQRLDGALRSELGSSRTATSRQQTLWATLDWSCALLSEPERVLIRRLAVFAGGWTLEAAEEVCTGGAVERATLLGHLTRLVDTSLVQVMERAGYARYRLLEPIRAYAAAHLAASQEAVVVRRAHAATYLALAEHLSDRTHMASEGQRMDLLELEHENFRVALRWSEETGAIEQGVRLCAALGRFWVVRGYISEGRVWITALLNAQGTAADSVTLARALLQAGNLAWYQGDPVAARLLHSRALALYCALPDAESGLPAVLDALGLDARSHGDYSEAQVFCTEALTLARSLGMAWVEVQAVYHLGLVAYDQMAWTEAHGWFAQCLTLAQEMGDTICIARALNGLAQVAHQAGDYIDARALYERGLAKRRELGELFGVALALVCLGEVLLDLGDLAQARTVLDESITITQELGDRQGMAQCLEAFAALASLAHQPEQAFRLLGAAAALRETSELPLSPASLAQLERRLGPARQALDEHTGAALRTDGHALPVDEAVGLARLSVTAARGEICQ
jgi:predicted ATPase/DNA-binding XRE family transcriptional regulator